MDKNPSPRQCTSLDRQTPVPGPEADGQQSPGRLGHSPSPTLLRTVTWEIFIFFPLMYSDDTDLWETM